MEGNSVKIKFSSIIILLAVYMPFENIILKFMPVSDTIYGYMRFGSEIIIYLLFVVMLMSNTLRGRLLHRTPIDWLLLLFVGLGLFSMFYNHSPIGASLIGMRDMLRYVFLFYIVSNVDFSSYSVKRFLYLFLIIAGIQGIIVALQHFFGISQFWYPRATNLSIAGHSTTFKLLKDTYQGGRELGSGIGTFGDTIPMGNYMLYAVALFAACFSGLLPFKRDKWLIFGIFYVLSFYALFCSYSRISVLLGVFMVPIVYILAGRLAQFTPIAIAGVLIITVVIGFNAVMPNSTLKSSYINPRFEYANPIENVMQAFSDQYVERSTSSSRGFIIENVIIPMLKSANIIGYGPDPETSLEKLALKDLPANIPFENVMNVADVYWLSIFTCYGLIGGGLFVAILIVLLVVAMRVYRKSDDIFYKIIAVAFAASIIIAFPYTIIIRTFVFRIYSFYFWFFAGLVAQEYRRIRLREKEEEERIKEMERAEQLERTFARPAAIPAMR